MTSSSKNNRSGSTAGSPDHHICIKIMDGRDLLASLTLPRSTILNDLSYPFIYPGQNSKFSLPLVLVKQELTFFPDATIVTIDYSQLMIVIEEQLNILLPGEWMMRNTDDNLIFVSPAGVSHVDRGVAFRLYPYAKRVTYEDDSERIEFSMLEFVEDKLRESYSKFTTSDSRIANGIFISKTQVQLCQDDSQFAEGKAITTSTSGSMVEVRLSYQVNKGKNSVISYMISRFLPQTIIMSAKPASFCQFTLYNGKNICLPLKLVREELSLFPRATKIDINFSKLLSVTSDKLGEIFSTGSSKWTWLTPKVNSKKEPQLRSPANKALRARLFADGVYNYSKAFNKLTNRRPYLVFVKDKRGEAMKIDMMEFMCFTIMTNQLHPTVVTSNARKAGLKIKPAASAHNKSTTSENKHVITASNSTNFASGAKTMKMTASAKIKFMEAKVFLESKDYLAAKNLFKATLELLENANNTNKRQAGTWIKLAECYEHLNQSKKALDCLNKALTLYQHSDKNCSAEIDDIQNRITKISMAAPSHAA